MPSHKIHLAIAVRVNKILNLDNDSIMLGSVLPDLSKNKEHSKAHYQKGKTDLEGLANPDWFLKENSNKMTNPVFVGYLIHLLTDKYYNKYFFENFFLYDKNNEGIGLIMKGKKITMDNAKKKYYKHHEFDKYDKWLLNHNYVQKFSSFNCLENVEDIKNIKFDKEQLKNYIIKSNKEIDKINPFSKLRMYNYKIADKETMDKLFNGCIDYIVEYLKKVGIINE